MNIRKMRDARERNARKINAPVHVDDDCLYDEAKIRLMIGAILFFFVLCDLDLKLLLCLAGGCLFMMCSAVILPYYPHLSIVYLVARHKQLKRFKNLA